MEIARSKFVPRDVLVRSLALFEELSNTEGYTCQNGLTWRMVLSDELGRSCQQSARMTCSAGGPRVLDETGGSKGVTLESMDLSDRVRMWMRTSISNSWIRMQQN